MATAGFPGLDASLALDGRAQRVQEWSRRRAVRARVACLVAVLAVAWCAHRASAGAAPAQASSEQQPLGAPAAAVASGATGEIVRLVGALAVVVALALAVQWWVRRSGLAPKGQGGAFEVVGRHALGRGTSVLVVRFGPRALLVQQGRDGLRTLCELSDPAEVDAALGRARGAAPAAAAERTVDLRRSKDGGA